MAKGARASSKKANRTKLRARVFAPVEKARADRLHAKLLDIISQPKPERPEMDTAEDSKRDLDNMKYLLTNHCSATTTTTTTEATKEEDLSKGSSLLTASIPRSLSGFSKGLDPAQESCEMRNFCFHLGLCSDIVGFNNDGDLEFAFDPLPPHWLSENQGLTVTT